MARVRNIGSIGRPKPIPVTHFIPPKFSPVYKIEIVTDSETIDVTKLLYSGEFSDGVTDKIGDFIFRLLDPTNNISNRIVEFDTINIYLDYGKIATTLRFSGKIERKSNAEQIFLDISGRSIAMITTGTNISYSSNGQKARSEILKDIINAKEPDGVTPKYFGGLISDSGIEDDLETMDVNYGEIPFWEIVTEICNAGTRDAYISPSLVFNYFKRDIRKNMTEAVVESINLIGVSDFAKDTEEMVTKVRVYGSTDGNVPIIYSSSSDTTQTKGITKEVKKDIGTILTPAQAKDLAISEAATGNIAPTLGSVTSLITPTILPGEKLKIANPLNNIPPAYYEINSFRHFFTVDGSPETTFTIKKDRIDISKVIKKTYKFQNEITENINPREMDFTTIYDYNISHGNKLFSGGIFDNVKLEIGSTGIGTLKVISGETGTWTSDEIMLDSPVSIIEIRENSTDLASSKFFVSLDKGIIYKEIGSNAGDFTFENPQNSIILRVEIKSSNTRIEKVGLLYRLQ